MTFRPRPEEGEGACHVDTQRKNVPGRGESKSISPEAEE